MPYKEVATITRFDGAVTMIVIIAAKCACPQGIACCVGPHQPAIWIQRPKAARCARSNQPSVRCDLYTMEIVRLRSAINFSPQFISVGIGFQNEGIVAA